MQDQTQEQSQPEPITKLSVDAKVLLNMFITWHGNATHQLLMLSEIPDTEDLVITNQDTGQQTVYDPIQRQAFFEGVAVALTIINDVPFLKGSAT